MKFWKDPAHVRMLLLYLFVSGVACAFSFYTDPMMGIVVAALCVMFTVLRLTAEVARDSRVRAMNQKVMKTLGGEEKPLPPDGGRGAICELDGNVYKLALRLSDREAELCRERAENDLLLRGIASHLVVRAEELPANVHRRELIALAHDMENLADLHGEPVQPEAIEAVSAATVWNDALVMAGETLRLQHITASVEASARAYVTTCPRAMLISGLRGLLETCARHAAVGSSWVCSAKETAVYTEFRITSDHFDWKGEALSSVFDSRADAEPALVYLARLAMIYSGEVRTEQTEGDTVHLILRLYKATR